MGKLNKHFLPDFFIPGAPKCGTTTLHDLFDKHPKISMSKIKEPGYWKNKKFNDFSETEISNYKSFSLCAFSFLAKLQKHYYLRLYYFFLN